MFTEGVDYLALQELSESGSPEIVRDGVVALQSWREIQGTGSRSKNKGQGDFALCRGWAALSCDYPLHLWLESCCGSCTAMTAAAMEWLVCPPSIILNVVKDDYPMILQASLCSNVDFCRYDGEAKSRPWEQWLVWVFNLQGMSALGPEGLVHLHEGLCPAAPSARTSASSSSFHEPKSYLLEQIITSSLEGKSTYKTSLQSEFCP